MLLYATESQRYPDTEAAQSAWQRLHSMPAQLVIGCLGEVCEALAQRSLWGETDHPYPPLDLIEIYRADCLRVARRFVKDGTEAQYFHRVPRRELGPTLALRIVGRYGDRSDIGRLRELSRAHPFARYALEAIKSLDAVSAERPSGPLNPAPLPHERGV